MISKIRKNWRDYWKIQQKDLLKKKKKKNSTRQHLDLKIGEGIRVNRSVNIYSVAPPIIRISDYPRAEWNMRKWRTSRVRDKNIANSRISSTRFMVNSIINSHNYIREWDVHNIAGFFFFNEMLYQPQYFFFQKPPWNPTAF